MKTKSTLITAVVIVCFVGNWGGVTRGVGDDEIKVVTMGKETLVGLHGVHVLVDGIEPEVEKLGLTMAKLQTDTELELRRYGIKVISKEERSQRKGPTPCLYVYVLVNTKPYDDF